jgi:hypothetical protein
MDLVVSEFYLNEADKNNLKLWYKTLLDLDGPQVVAMDMFSWLSRAQNLVSNTGIEARQQDIPLLNIRDSFAGLWERDIAPFRARDSFPEAFNALKGFGIECTDYVLPVRECVSLAVQGNRSLLHHSARIYQKGHWKTTNLEAYFGSAFFDNSQHGNDVFHDSVAMAISFYVFYFLPQFSAYQQPGGGSLCNVVSYGTFGITAGEAPERPEPLSKLLRSAQSASPPLPSAAAIATVVPAAWQYTAMYRQDKPSMNSKVTGSAIRLSLAPMVEEVTQRYNRPGEAINLAGTVFFVGHTQQKESGVFSLQVFDRVAVHQPVSVSTWIPGQESRSYRVLQSVTFCTSLRVPLHQDHATAAATDAAATAPAQQRGRGIELPELELIVTSLASGAAVIEIASIVLSSGCTGTSQCHAKFNASAAADLPSITTSTSSALSASPPAPSPGSFSRREGKVLEMIDQADSEDI